MIALYLATVESREDREKVLYIYENFYSTMEYSVRQVLKDNNSDVEDVVHNCMLKLIDNLEYIDFSDTRRVKNLCIVVARNKAIDHCRQKNNRNASLEDFFVEPSSKNCDPGDILIKRDTYDTILSTIYSLDDKYRDVCLLKYVNELKEREIAEILDIPPKTVNTRIFRAKQILREALRKENLDV